MKILIYEDSGYKNLYPLNLLRAAYDIRCGANTILQRTVSILDNKFDILLHCRNSMAAYLKEVHKHKINSLTADDYILLNGRVIFTGESIKYLLSRKVKDSYYVFNNEIVAAFITKDKIRAFIDKAGIGSDENVFDAGFFGKQNLERIILKDNFNIRIINYAWDVIDYLTHGGIEEDLNKYFKGKRKFRRIKGKDNLINGKKIYGGKNIIIKPQVVLDASEGAIVIDDNTEIEPFTYIKGPVYIGKNCLVKSGTKIYGPCVIGEYSKVAGEIAETIFHSYINKQHGGFVGHSYICPFVNLGADTVTSDLKNNYSDIKIKSGGKEIDTGMKFIGSIVGDHSKTSVNTMLNTGSIIGIFANIFGGGFHSKNIESFSWNEAGKNPVKYDIEKAIETAKKVMMRRNLKMSEAYENLLRSYFNN